MEALIAEKDDPRNRVEHPGFRDGMMRALCIVRAAPALAAPSAPRAEGEVIHPLLIQAERDAAASMVLDLQRECIDLRRRLTAYEADAGEGEGTPQRDPDEPWLDVVADDHPCWQIACPKCGAEPEAECTSLVSGCCPDGAHAERLLAALPHRAPEVAPGDHAPTTEGEV